MLVKHQSRLRAHLVLLNFHFQEQILGDLLHVLNPVGREGGVGQIHVTDALTRLTHRCSHIARFPVLHRLKETDMSRLNWITKHG